MFTGNENNQVTLEAAAALTSKYRLLFPGGTKGMYLSKDSINNMLNQTDVVGARIYFGLSTDLKMTAVMVGVTADGNDVTSGIVLDNGTMCPPNCSINNILNSLL